MKRMWSTMIFKKKSIYFIVICKRCYISLPGVMFMWVNYHVSGCAGLVPASSVLFLKVHLPHQTLHSNGGKHMTWHIFLTSPNISGGEWQKENSGMAMNGEMTTEASWHVNPVWEHCSNAQTSMSSLRFCKKYIIRKVAEHNLPCFAAEMTSSHFLWMPPIQSNIRNFLSPSYNDYGALKARIENKLIFAVGEEDIFKQWQFFFEQPTKLEGLEVIWLVRACFIGRLLKLPTVERSWGFSKDKTPYFSLSLF